MNKVKETTKFIKEKMNINPKIGIILGSGLGNLADIIKEKQEIDYKDIPNFPESTVKGHKGKLVLGKINGIEILAMQGRFHYYEGYSMKEVTYPLFCMKELGIEKIIVSNAAGGINRSFEQGDLMIITDHINLFGDNPLIGKNDERFGPRFCDMSEPYSYDLIDKAKNIAKDLCINYKKGVYVGVTGPYYETAAEIRFLSTIGADAVGMSTVPEVIAANYLGMNVLGISVITNMATGIAHKKHIHSDVVKTANRASEKFVKWVSEIIKEI